MIFAYNEPLFIATKRRQKGMVMILCVCVFGKTVSIGDSNKLLADFRLHKKQK